jgi:6-phosphogluconolactonase
MSVELVVVPTAEEAAREGAERLAGAAAAGGAIALAGGSTPRRVFELAAQIEPDWSRASVWWGDERCVPPDDPRSNYLMANDALISRLTRPPEIHRIRGELAPDAAADEYDAALAEVALDLVLLGLGPDGHTASLFPNAPTLDERSRRAVSAEAGLEPFVPRVTMTIPELASAAEVLFLVTGAEKADAVKRAFAGAPSPDTPSSLVRSAAGSTVAVLDSAAAVQL